MNAQILGWKHLVNWGRTLGIGGMLFGIPMLIMGALNGNSILTGAAEGDVTNVSTASVQSILGGISLVTSLIATWRSTGRITPTDSTVQDAFKQLAILALDSPIAATLLQRLKSEIAPVKQDTPVDPSVVPVLLSPDEYLKLLEQAVRKEVAKSIIK